MAKKNEMKILPGVQVRGVFHKQPIRREKHDRNKPCPCGSGKKYKKCCADEANLTLWQKIKSYLWPFGQE
jgi:hypothetical protein